MEAVERIERALADVLTSVEASVETPGGPPGLASAMRYSVFPGGARIRPRLCLAVAEALGDDAPSITDAAAAAIELLHCASLVHDDLPCFDNAPTRRGKASVHRAYGERLAVLTGDALIVLAFQALAPTAAVKPARLAPLLTVVAQGVGSPNGIVAGQAWECEPSVGLSLYQRAKTGALFAAATAAGAAAAGADPAPWHALGELLGEAYQVADDIRDVAAEAEELGKPIGVDQLLGRPNAAGQLGLQGAMHRLQELVTAALASIPPCPGREGLRQHILAEAQGLLPRKLARPAA